MTRFWSDGLAVAVASDSFGAPQLLRLHEHVYPVTLVVLRWRIRQHWWRAPLWREYFVVTLPGPLLVQLYHDLPHGGWAVEYVYD